LKSHAVVSKKTLSFTNSCNNSRNKTYLYRNSYYVNTTTFTIKTTLPKIKQPIKFTSNKKPNYSTQKYHNKIRKLPTTSFNLHKNTNHPTILNYKRNLNPNTYTTIFGKTPSISINQHHHIKTPITSILALLPTITITIQNSLTLNNESYSLQSPFTSNTSTPRILARFGKQAFAQLASLTMELYTCQVNSQMVVNTKKFKKNL